MPDGIATVHTGIHTADVDVTVTLHTSTLEPGDQTVRGIARH
ncbi:hypothetical protein [Streptomyces sp. NPDC003273]